MLSRGRSYYDRHFFFSNQLVQYLLGFRPNQSSVEVLLLCSAVIAYLLPLIVYQKLFFTCSFTRLSKKSGLNKQSFESLESFYQLYTIDGNLQSAIKVLKSILSFLFVLYCYITAYFNLTTIKLLFSHVRLDYELATSEEELSIMEKKKARQPFSCDERYTANPWGSRTLQGELDWMIDIIKCHKRVTELIFQLFSKILNRREAIGGFIYMIMLVFTLHFNFYLGQLLINYNNAAFRELCNIPFYILSIKTQKLFLFLLTRSIKPCEISIFGIFVISHKVLAAIIQRAFSLAMVLVLYLRRTMTDKGYGLYSNQNSYNQMFVFCVVMVHILPLIMHQFYQIYMLDIKMKSTLKVLKLITPVLQFVYCYVTFYFSLTKTKLLFAHMKFDYEFVTNEEELNIMEKYTNRSRLYVRLLTFPSILNVFLYILGTKDGILLTLPFPVHNILQPGLKKARQPFSCDERYTANPWGSRTLQGELDWMIDIIKCHKRVTELVFQLFNKILNTREITEGFVYLIVFLSTLYINFYMGQLLINCNNAAFTELCNIPFYILSIKTQKMLLFLLTRSIKPSVISISGIFVLSYKVLSAMQKLLVNFTNRMDNCELFLDKNELYILDKYVKQFKLITIIFTSSGSLYGISMTLPSILSVFFNIFETVNGVHVTLPFPVNNVSNAGPFYYGLLIYEITAIFITLIITCVSFSSYLILQFPTILKNTDEMFECFIVIVESLSTAYISFYMGQMVIDHSTAVFQELCQVPFYMLSEKAQKLLLLIIARSMKPCHISIGGIFIASHEIFAKIIQKVFSFAMVFYKTPAIGCDDVVINLKHGAIDSNEGVTRMCNKVEARGLFISRQITLDTLECLLEVLATSSSTFFFPID
uniref:Uncharacterized protein n=1 Tax=Vespula pensylvanica TaxID=30213 RepID=A0A834KN81_VESPE|nr:hypothetical protein H0235_013646 [Vespula pensylvanica]